MNAKKSRALRKVAAEMARKLNLPKSGYQNVGTHTVAIMLPAGLNPDGTPKLTKGVALIVNPARLVKSARSLYQGIKAQYKAGLKFA